MIDIFMAATNLKTDGSTSSIEKKAASKNLAERMSKILVGEGTSKKWEPELLSCINNNKDFH